MYNFSVQTIKLFMAIKWLDKENLHTVRKLERLCILYHSYDLLLYHMLITPELKQLKFKVVKNIKHF